MNIVLIGKPGCGKGTLSNELKKEGWYQLSPGEIMREKMKDNDELAQMLRDLLNKGNFAPDEVTIGLVKDAVAKLPPGTNVMFDGFPRTVAQAKMLADSFPIDAVVHFEISDELITQRIVNRLVHQPSGRVYNTLFNPPKKEGVDDITGEALTRRADDSPELISQRLANYMTLTYPAYEYLIQAGLPNFSINAAAPSSESTQEVKEKLAQLTTLENKKSNKLSI